MTVRPTSTAEAGPTRRRAPFATRASRSCGFWRERRSSLSCGRSVMPGETLRGRGRECAQVDALIQNASRGRGGSLVFRGEAGVGKTTLLDYAGTQRTGFHVVRVGGVESEVELPYAALLQLCGKMLHLAGRLPAPQADALGIAFGQKSGEVPDRFHVSLAV